MTPISSRALPVFDISEPGFRGAAGDIGEALAFLAGGVKPDADTLSRLCLSLRGLQGFLMGEADQQASREAVARELRGLDLAVQLVKFPIAFMEFGSEHGFPPPNPLTRESLYPIEAVS